MSIRYHILKGVIPMKKSTRILALVMTVVMFLGACPAFAESIFDIFPREDGPITLTVYSQLANYSGMQGGWSSTLLEDKFNVKVNIIPDSDGTYETRMESGNLGDIVVWGSNGEDYQNAVDKGMLLDWEEDDLMQTWAPYITENYTAALEANRKNNGNDKIHGFGFNVATTEGAHQSFFYTWDLRWDLYKELGYPAVKDLDGLLEVFKQMKAICPTDENGNETYAVSVWPDWDGSMVMYVKALATAYYGYDELGIGHINPTNGEYYDCL
ncbi:MAG: extracellular solute-binding protein, partial [Clostridia bacterium]|nr:extracellular solute-binding protein [Clostridia bacterium]